MNQVEVGFGLQHDEPGVVLTIALFKIFQRIGPIAEKRILTGNVKRRKRTLYESGREYHRWPIAEGHVLRLAQTLFLRPLLFEGRP